MDQWIIMDIEGTLLTKKVQASYIYKQNLIVGRKEMQFEITRGKKIEEERERERE
jgi:hypothetical protein